MGYLSLWYWAVKFSYITVATLIVLLFVLKKDKYETQGPLFDQQRWDIYDVLICVLLLNFSFLIVQFLKQWFLLQIAVFWLLNFTFFYIVFKFRIKQNLSIIGLSKNGLLRKMLYGIKVLLVFELFFYGMLFLTPRPKKFLANVQSAYNNWSAYQDNLYAIIILISIYIIVAPMIEELIRGLMYSPFRRKAGKWGAILLTSIIFALYHGHWFILQLAIYAYVYEKRRSLTSSIAAHSFYNILGVTTFIYTTDFFDIGYKVNHRSYVGIIFSINLIIYIIILFIGPGSKHKTGREKGTDVLPQ